MSIYQQVIKQDPGLLRLKHAFKTILSVIITVALLIKFNPLIIACGGLAAGFSMQGLFGLTRLDQVKSALFNATIYLVVYTLGTFTQPHPMLSTLFLALLGFCAFYSRTWGARFTVMPIMAWILGFLGTVLPHPVGLQNLGYSLLAFILGFFITLLIYLFIFPVRKEKTFLTNLDNQLKGVQFGLKWLMTNFQGAFDKQTFLIEKAHRSEHLQKLLLLNESIADYFSSKNLDAEEKALNLYLAQYTINKASGMITGASCNLLETQATLSDATRKTILNTLRYFIHLINQVTVDTQKNLVHFNDDRVQTNTVLLTLKDAILQCPPGTNSHVIFLINLRLGFNQLWKNLTRLNGGAFNAP
jgi:hypothetical protein